MEDKLIPKHLAPGSKVVLLSPSSPAAYKFPHRVERAVQCLETLFGFNIQIGRNALKNGAYTAGTIEERVSDIHEAFSDSTVDGIICMIGGNHSNQIISHIDLKIIAENPKVFVGYSDITVLHLFFFSCIRMISFYGPAALPEFAEFPKIFSYTENYFRKTVMRGQSFDLVHANEWTDERLDWNIREDLTRPRHLVPNTGYVTLRQGEARGTLLGGCLNSFTHILGSKFCPNWRGAILFIETSESPGSIALADSLLHDLKNAGVFEQISGLLVGRPYQYSLQERNALWQLILKLTSDSQYPIIANVDVGHTDPMITLPIGVEADIIANSDYLRITVLGPTVY